MVRHHVFVNRSYDRFIFQIFRRIVHYVSYATEDNAENQAVKIISIIDKNINEEKIRKLVEIIFEKVRIV